MKKTVKDAVEHFKGVWPYEHTGMVYNKGSFGSYSDWLSNSAVGLNTLQWQFVCTREEFEQEVKRQKQGQASADWYDYDNILQLALAPVGAKVEYTKIGSAEDKYWECVVIAHEAGEAVIKTVAGHYHKRPMCEYKFRPLDHNRKQLEQEEIKSKTVFAAYDQFMSIDGNLRSAFEKLYDIGALRPVDDWGKN